MLAIKRDSRPETLTWPVFSLSLSPSSLVRGSPVDSTRRSVSARPVGTPEIVLFNKETGRERGTKLRFDESSAEFELHQPDKLVARLKQVSWAG